MEILHNVNYLWLIAGAILIIIEFMVLSGVGFLFAGLGALTVGALGEFGVINTLPGQWIAFFATTFVWVVSLWKPLKNYKLNHQAASFTDVVGKKAILISALAPGQTGQARWSGTTMNTKLDPSAEAILSPGTEVTIIAVEGNVLIVK